MGLFEAVLSSVVATLVSKAVEIAFTPKPQAVNETPSENQKKVHWFLKKVNKFTSYVMVAVLLIAFIYNFVQQRFFPTVVGCVDQTLDGKPVSTYETPNGNKGSSLPKGCYTFDARNKKGDWVRVRSDIDSIDGKWIQACSVSYSLCQLDPAKPSFWDCFFNQPGSMRVE